ncbi:MAG: DEAD/DEAH box helicase family protein [Oscillospiraceae bacterium]|nr:DEAD/DEAH box helicase family protein [Oscillospiraceae bacterium]
MNDKQIVSKINGYLFSARKELCEWLNNMLPRVTDEWWQECVLSNLSYAQKKVAVENNYSNLDQFDLSALLRITDKSWYDMRSFAYLPTADRECVRAMVRVRNNWAHITGEVCDKDLILGDLDVILKFFENVIITNIYSENIHEFRQDIEATNFSAVYNESTDDLINNEKVNHIVGNCEIKERDQVYITGDPDTKGMVFSVTDVNGINRYEVFVDGNIRTFYEGQICKIDVAPAYSWVDLSTFQSNLTAYEINNPSAGNLYSLNAARIDFVPYQFRPALKMIKADEPRILIADSVGVGKTIEAGLIIKEMEARNELENILIICPKPLVAERKWELEMKRFDEEFTQMDGQTLRQVISDTHRDEEWPARCSKAIIPYSILDERVYNGEDNNRGRSYGLLDLDPPPHFDLVIIDEAHHIRNGSIDKEKAFAYKCVRYFCEHADAVVMLTATPLQTSDDDLYTLLNLLRPDVVMDKEIFRLMSRPNEFIYRCSHVVRGAADGWQNEAKETLKNVITTQWGENVIAKNPLYNDILDRLNRSEISREERVKLVSDIESLHSFNTMINRTRRKDIQDFCVRRSFTVETSFTQEQSELHDELLKFEYNALSVLHNVRSIPFMMSTIRRQAASCIFGLAPQIHDIINRRFKQISDDPEIDVDDLELESNTTSVLVDLAKRVIYLAENLPEEDPKFESVLKIVEEKQKIENNKIILFSSFRHTLNYVYKKFKSLNYRVAQIDGSVKDDERRALRERFELDRNNPEALDMLLFTEVGSEGLDYQFCDTMINYDLPWNPMRIEQRIGRIDRRGQKSEAVNIYNIITSDTVDADIYSRCLMRIGIFERSIGECEEVLGSIGAQIEQIAVNTGLTQEERRIKLEQMADNEIRRMQELSKLEDEERAFFGFDLSNYTAAKEIKDAESPWLSPANIQKLIERYLNERLGEGQYIVGTSGLKQLRLGKEARLTLLEDFRKLTDIRTGMKRKWELYLKGSEPLHMITFHSEVADKERKAFFVTATHPLVKQAAKHFATNEISYIHVEHYSDDLPEGSYPFSIYAWSYVGMQPTFKVVPVCENSRVSEEILNILQESNTAQVTPNVNRNTWDKLESTHIALWQAEKEQYIIGVENTANYKLESISSNYRNRKRNLEQKIKDAFDERIQRMYQSELQSATEKYNSQVSEINEHTSRADIHTTLVAKGIIDIRKG